MVTPEALLRQLDDPKTRFAAALSLGRLQYRPALTRLIQLLSNSDAGTRWAAAYALGLMGDRVVIANLKLLLKDTDAMVRLAAARALGNLHAREATDDLIALLNDDAPAVREAASVALQLIGVPSESPKRERSTEKEKKEERDAKPGSVVSTGAFAPVPSPDEQFRADVMSWLMSAVQRMTGAERGFIALKSSDTGKLEYQAGVGIPPAAQQDFVSGNTPLLEEAAQSGETIITTNAQRDARFQQSESIVSFSLRSLMAVPIEVDGNVVGVIYGDNRLVKGLFTNDPLVEVKALAEQTAAVLFSSLPSAPSTEQNQPAPPPPPLPELSLGDLGGSAAKADPVPQSQPAPPAKPVTEVDLLDDAYGGAAAEMDDETELTPALKEQHDPEFFSRVEKDDTPSEVQFSAYYPHQAQANRRHGLYVYAHIPEALAQIGQDVERFREELGGQIRAPKQAKQTAQLKRDTPVTVEPESDELEFEPASLTKKWHDDWTRFDFDFRPPSTFAGETAVVRISIKVGAVEIAHINFSLNVVEKLLETAEMPAVDNPLVAAKLTCKTASVYQRIFISYSRKDKEVAENYRLAQLAMGNEVFMDTYSIRTGENWQAALARAIDQADIFQLFWSQNSADSENVRDEWDYALRVKCPDTGCDAFIRPVFWIKPMPDPPEKLSHLNFRFVPFAPPE